MRSRSCLSCSLVASLSLLASACGDSGSDDPSAADSGEDDTASSGPSSTTPSSTGDTPSSTSASSTVSDDGGSEAPADGGSTDDTGTPGEVALPPADGGLDYQLGGAYAPPRGVTILSRDRNESPADGLYNVCYVNGFQAQPDENDFWLNDHPELVLRDAGGDPVIDEDWDEMLLDTSTAEKRTALAEIVGGWITQCGTDGFDAVEIDNLDSYSRSDGALDQDGAVEYMAMLSAAAHAADMAIAQKNSTELVPRKSELGTDFVVSEECSTYDECGDYIDAYGEAVLMIEYVQADFEKGCGDWPGYSIVLRDVELTMPGDGAYVFDGC